MSDLSYRRGMVMGGLLVGGLLITGAVIAGILAAILQNGDEEERPPIIVGNGSVHFEAFSLTGDTGFWTEEPANSGIWRHDYSGRNGPQKFTVWITGGSSPNCFLAKHDNVKELAFDYIDSGTKTIPVKIQRTVGIDPKRYLVVEASGHPVRHADPSLWVGPNGNKIAKVTLTLNNNKEIACEFGENSVPGIAIQQRIK